MAGPDEFFTSWGFMLAMLGSLCCVSVVGIGLIVVAVYLVSRRDRRSPPDGDFRP